MQIGTVTVIAVVGLLVCLAADPAQAYRYKPKGYRESAQRWQQFYGQLEREVDREFRDWKRFGTMSPRFRTLIDAMRVSKSERKAELRELPTAREGAFCGLCRSFGGSVLNFRRDGASRDEVFNTTYELCTMLEIQEAHICRGLIELNIDLVLYIVDNRPSLTAGSLCAVVFQSDVCVLEDPSFTDWSVSVAPGGAPITGSKQLAAQRGPNDLKIVHLTDFHYDSNYRTGYNAACGQPACCRESQGIPENPEEAAGHWGDYRDCDTPWNAVEDLIDHVVELHPDADLVYHTGDVIDHGIWETSIGHNIRSLNLVNEKLRQVYPDTPVYNTLGNHEAHPVNIYPLGAINRPDFSSDWLYHFAADAWSHWLPTATQATIRQGGYYTALVRPGFRIVALNNNECYTYNFWILFQPDTLSDQLQWLHDVLLESERNGEKVHLLAHIPVGADCFRVYQREFRRIVERFWDTISGQFHGHTHRDEFNVFYSLEEPSHAINVAWNGGSGTAYSFVNPNYVVYYVEPETYQVTDFESYIYNLTDANLTPEQRPTWFQQYAFSDTFDVSNAGPAAVDELLQRFATPAGRADLQRYWEFKVKMGDPSLEAGCADDCLLHHLCEIVSTQADDDRKCQELGATFFG